MLYAPRFTTIANSAASPAVIFRPRFGRPKTMKNSCTTNGVLRMISTYAPQIRLNQVVRPLRIAAPKIPIASPPTVAITVS